MPPFLPKKSWLPHFHFSFFLSSFSNSLVPQLSLCLGQNPGLHHLLTFCQNPRLPHFHFLTFAKILCCPTIIFKFCAKILGYPIYTCSTFCQNTGLPHIHFHFFTFCQNPRLPQFHAFAPKPSFLITYQQQLV